MSSFLLNFTLRQQCFQCPNTSSSYFNRMFGLLDSSTSFVLYAPNPHVRHYRVDCRFYNYSDCESNFQLAPSSHGSFVSVCDVEFDSGESVCGIYVVFPHSPDRSLVQSSSDVNHCSCIALGIPPLFSKRINLN